MDDFDYKTLGISIGLGELGISSDNVSAEVINKYAAMEEEDKASLIDNVYVKLASYFKDVLDYADENKYLPESYIFNKIASANSSNWNEYYQNVMDTTISAAYDSTEAMHKYANPASALGGITKGIAGITGSMSGATLAAIPVLGALLAGAGYMLEKNVNEDTAETEKQKAKNIAYRSLAADIVRRLKEKGLTIENPEDYE